MDPAKVDIIEIIRRTIAVLPDGPYSLGLRSVLRHVEVAAEHLARGQEQQADAAFTDAIYRTNQAFEGSVKEAYRVLAGKNPSGTTPYEIENYLQSHKVFRDRVLTQFTAYRKEWRNPSTHDYTLDFDEAEAFLAIVSVAAFAKLLIDQIIEKVSSAKVEEDLRKSDNVPIKPEEESLPLVELTTRAVERFANEYMGVQDNGVAPIWQQVTGALSAYLTRLLPEAKLTLEPKSSEGDVTLRPDMIVSRRNEVIIIELRRMIVPGQTKSGLLRMRAYSKPFMATGGILFLYSKRGGPYSSYMELVDGLRVSIVTTKYQIDRASTKTTNDGSK